MFSFFRPLVLGPLTSALFFHFDVYFIISIEYASYNATVTSLDQFIPFHMSTELLYLYIYMSLMYEAFL